jgi:4'-phosphopantetheinyl transferase
MALAGGQNNGLNGWQMIASERLPYSNTPRSWSLMPDRPLLGTGDVHIWRVSLDQPQAIVERFRQLLSVDEQARAARFHFERDRQHFIVARGCLRTILARYLEIDPREIQFAYTPYGKPELSPPSSQAQPLNFNLAHSGGFALYALTEVGEIGVDLEHVRPEFTGDDIARRFFSSDEIASLTKLPANVRHEAFFNCWTRKEAFIKAKGMGLSLPLDQFDVTLAPGEPATLLRTRWDESEASRWSLQAIDLGPGYVAAVAVASRDWELSFFDVDTRR